MTERIPSSLSLIKDTLEQFQKIQRYMMTAREENATKTYESMKDEYLSLRLILSAAGVDLTNIDKIKV